MEEFSVSVSNEIKKHCAIHGLTPDVLLRRLLKMPEADGIANEPVRVSITTQHHEQFYIAGDGYRLPVGLELVKKLRKDGKIHHAKVEREGISINGETGLSLSAAARKINGNVQANGRTFWQYIDKNGKWRSLNDLGK